MLAQETVDRIERLLAEGELSQRKIAKLVGVSRGTVGGIASGNRPDYERLKQERADKLPQPKGPLRRCSTCGARVQLPCMACHIRDLAENGQAADLFTSAEGLIELELRGEHRRRYEEVVLQRLLADVRAELDPLDLIEFDEDAPVLDPSDLFDAFETEDEQQECALETC